ncbi:hypothetical protein [Labrys sp. ZIDIC5]|uniref:hypothetical protein n=1 Tax=Labrys sedimenti TaxID=3106036 RepID=UPI002ACA9522|nr:hypothetical protein [Labrys sp. ZIDIC5]MDZ5454869.1 hypothetical protein [Labrys sp. ZIDIC5]
MTTSKTSVATLLLLLNIIFSSKSALAENYIRITVPFYHYTSGVCGVSSGFSTPEGVEYACADTLVNVTFSTNGALGPKRRSDSFLKVVAEDPAWHPCGVFVNSYNDLGGGTALAVQDSTDANGITSYQLHAAAVSPGAKAWAHVSLRWVRFVKGSPSILKVDCATDGFAVTPIYSHPERFEQDEYGSAATYHQCTWTQTESGPSVSCH